MSWTHSSKVIALGVLLAVALGAAGIAAGVTFTDDTVPEDAEVGEDVTWSVTMEDPFDGVPSDDWTLRATTELDDADITLTTVDIGGDTIEDESVAANTADIRVARGVDDQSDVNEVKIEISGTVPEIEEYNYHDKEVENFLALELLRVDNGDEITLADGGASWEVHRYTEESQNARQAIDRAFEAANDADSDDALDRAEEAAEHYDSGNFERASSAAEDAEDIAEGEGQTQQLLLMIGAGILVVAILAGGVYYWKERQQDTSKLQ